MADAAPRNISEDQLRRQLAGGCHGAFDLLIERYYLPLCGYVRSRTRFLDSHEVKNLAQETLCRFWEHRQQFCEVGSLRALLWGIASNVVGEHLRRRQVQTHSPLPGDLLSTSPSPEAEAYGRELERRLQGLLVELTEAQRVALELKSAGLSAKEIARQLGCSPKAVERRLESARQHLRRRLSPEDDAVGWPSRASRPRPRSS